MTSAVARQARSAAAMPQSLSQPSDSRHKSTISETNSYLLLNGFTACDLEPRISCDAVRLTIGKGKSFVKKEGVERERDPPLKRFLDLCRVFRESHRRLPCSGLSR